MLTGTGPASGDTRPSAAVPPIELSLPSAEPSGNATNDRIYGTFYPALQSTQHPTPAVILLHPLGEGRNRHMTRFAHYLAQRGIGGLVLTLPYHMRRRPSGERAGRRFTDPDVERVIQAAKQSLSDVSTAVTWLSQQPTVDPHRIGIVGVSFGAVVAHAAMGKDERLTAGVAILGGGDLAELRRRSLAYRLRRLHGAAPLTADQAERLRQVDPLYFADRNRPRHVLMIQAARDLLIPPRNAVELWEALGRPPIQWIDTNHYAPSILPESLMRTSAAYLHSVWNDPSDDPVVPPVYALSLKLGLLIGLQSHLTPAIQWQFHSFATRRDHLSLLHTDLGWSGRGPFLGLAATLNPFIDVGIAHRFTGQRIHPYISLHIAF
jgi:dienelactone hydrolase